MTPIEWAENRLARDLNPATIAEYQRVWTRINKTRSGVSGNGRTRAVERAAARFKLARTIIDNRHNPAVVDQLWAAVTRLDGTADAARSAYKRGLLAGSSQKRHTKRRSLRGLPQNWRELLTGAARGSKYGVQIAILAASGCRPAEMVNGVTVARLDGEVIVRIVGAKVSDNTGGGQLWRELRLDAVHPLLSGFEPGRYDVPKARGIEDAIEHFGRQLWPNRAEPISAYSLRHAAASDFKASGLGVREIAAALGHQSTATMQRYGSANRRGGGLVLNSVKAASEVREPKKGAKIKSTKRSKPSAKEHSPGIS